MNDMQLMQSAAFDVQSLSGLKLKLSGSPEKGLRQVTQQLEATFVQMMLKSMRSALPQDGLFSSEQTQMLTSMYDQQIAQDLAQKGLGFGDMMYQQLAQSQGLSVEGALKPLDSTLMGALPTPAMAQIVRRFAPLGDAVLAPLQKVKALSSNNQDFISKLIEPAKAASQKSGISHFLILAQAALESGWGRREILTTEGENSHNVFGIKASKSWEGPITNIMTTEVINGKSVKMRDNFRVYGSYEEAIADYINLLTENPRYQKVKQAQSPEIAARRLHQAGYATDPSYSDKLVSLINQIRGDHSVEKTISRVIKAYTVDLNDIF
ncbi:flagellar assembly peptidoglycan hydrolase FlgJ [Providencia burhodogranariea]|uniref:Peptidoglycan hydrolase FlgJ n=1 Tax=Providencia burhodogranariea DSM 19968 TaxID=1141662 RepID=K8WQI5_9GAMM|nr:flagellar assembly peptidoglycan hydrolase FlgJ [Providencia burhodogranariea]EKT62236.1 flagellar rod assembly protein/muramidase FlgJ [Providencia burhodogranariea DSM 19968]